MIHRSDIPSAPCETGKQDIGEKYAQIVVFIILITFGFVLHFFFVFVLFFLIIILADNFRRSMAQRSETLPAAAILLAASDKPIEGGSFLTENNEQLWELNALSFLSFLSFFFFCFLFCLDLSFAYLIGTRPCR